MADAMSASGSLLDTTNADELRELRVQQRSDERVATLNRLVDDFNDFNEDLHTSEQEQRESAEARTQRLERYIERLQGNIAVEAQQRMEVVEDLYTNLDQQCANLDAEQADRLVDARKTVEVDIALLDNRIERTDVVFEEDKIATQRAIERAHRQLLRTLQELKDALGVEIAMRIEREASTAAKISDEVFALQELLQGEAGAFQATLGQMRDDEEDAAALLVKSNEAFKHAIMRQLTKCQRDLRTEMEERRAVEKQFIANLQDYAGGLIDGLKNVNRRVRNDGLIR